MFLRKKHTLYCKMRSIWVAPTKERLVVHSTRVIVMRSIIGSSPCSLFCSAITITITVLLIDHFKWTITPSCKEFIGALEWLWKKIVKNCESNMPFYLMLVVTRMKWAFYETKFLPKYFHQTKKTFRYTFILQFTDIGIMNQP